MAELVGAAWIAERLEKPGFTLIDPRRPMKYLAGHLPGAINIAVYKAFGAAGKLLAPEALADFIGAAGLDDSSTPVLYDSPEGQDAAMLAWILEYLGRGDVRLMDIFFEAWKSSAREVRYKPVETAPRSFPVRANAAIRATLEEVRGARVGLVDFRSREEFAGERSFGGDPPGHIPGAANLPWRDLTGPNGALLRPASQIERMFAEAGIARGAELIAYCRNGPRAALGYLALRQLGYDVRLFDGSYAEWSRAGLPIAR